MQILLLGSGGREHALAWKLVQSTKCDKLFIAPGNAGTALLGENVNINPNDFEAVKALVLEKQISMVVCGPEEPLVRGIQGFFQADAALKEIAFIGPSPEGAQLEGSKAFSKKFMQEMNIPTAGYLECTAQNLAEGLAWLDKQQAPYVLKADGLAAGKGVLIIDNVEEAKQELSNMLGGKFGDASKCVVLEQFLSGIEFSVFALTDGKSWKVLPEAKDYKRIGEGDTGPNTGGMGAVSPVTFADADMMAKVETRIIKPTIKGLQQRGIGYTGFIFFGLISVNGEPYVIEYNCRMGDPETEVVIPRLKTDLVDLFEAATSGYLSEIELDIDSRTAVTVMMVSGGYPDAYEKGKVINGTNLVTDSIVFHAGTTRKGDDLVTNGGRVLSITSYGNSVVEAASQSFESAGKISFEGCYYRRDIGKDLMG